jgi:hypothetical protein
MAKKSLGDQFVLIFAAAFLAALVWFVLTGATWVVTGTIPAWGYGSWQNRVSIASFFVLLLIGMGI